MQSKEWKFGDRAILTKQVNSYLIRTKDEKERYLDPFAPWSPREEFQDAVRECNYLPIRVLDETPHCAELVYVLGYTRRLIGPVTFTHGSGIDDDYEQGSISILKSFRVYAVMPIDNNNRFRKILYTMPEGLEEIHGEF